jgi:hypothetical protein
MNWGTWGQTPRCIADSFSSREGLTHVPQFITTHHPIRATPMDLFVFTRLAEGFTVLYRFRRNTQLLLKFL